MDTSHTMSFQATPKAADDVFQTPLRAQPWTPVEFERRPLKELFSSAFSKAELAVRNMPIINVINNGPIPPHVRALILYAQDHVQHQKLAWNIMENQQDKYCLMTGLVSRPDR